MAPPALAATDVEPSLIDTPSAAPKIVPAVPDHILNGIGLVIASTLFFSGGDVAAKLMTGSMPALEITWFRYIFFALLVLPLTFLAYGPKVMATKRPGLQIFRGMGVVVSSILFVMGLEYLQPAEATAINFISPLFITALSIPLLGERVGFHRWAATAVGFLGVMLIVRPGSSAFQPAALYPIGTAIAWASAAIATRMMTTERPEATLAWTAVVGVVGLSLGVVFVWHKPTLSEIEFGAISGGLSAIGHWCVIKAYRTAPASVIAPFSYAQLIFAGGMGYLAFGVLPGPSTLIGGIVIAASGLYSAHRERRGL